MTNVIPSPAAGPPFNHHGPGNIEIAKLVEKEPWFAANRGTGFDQKIPQLEDRLLAQSLRRLELTVVEPSGTSDGDGVMVSSIVIAAGQEAKEEWEHIENREMNQNIENNPLSCLNRKSDCDEPESMHITFGNTQRVDGYYWL